MTVFVAKVRKNSTEELRVSLDEYRGHQLLSMRIWFRSDDGEMRPGKAGLAKRVELLPEVRAAVIGAEAEALRLGLIKGSRNRGVPPRE